MGEERRLPNPDVPKNTLIATGTDMFGREIKVASGFCLCNEQRDESKGEFRLERGEGWLCFECGRTYFFDGERVKVSEPPTGMPVE